MRSVSTRVLQDVDLAGGCSCVLNCRINKNTSFLFLLLFIRERANILIYTLVIYTYRLTNSEPSLLPLVENHTLTCGRDGTKTCVYSSPIQFNTVKGLVCSYILCNTT
jgi:hypothetical protein